MRRPRRQSRALGEPLAASPEPSSVPALRPAFRPAPSGACNPTRPVSSNVRSARRTYLMETAGPPHARPLAPISAPTPPSTPSSATASRGSRRNTSPAGGSCSGCSRRRWEGEAGTDFLRANPAPARLTDYRDDPPFLPVTPFLLGIPALRPPTAAESESDTGSARSEKGDDSRTKGDRTSNCFVRVVRRGRDSTRQDFFKHPGPPSGSLTSRGIAR